MRAQYVRCALTIGISAWLSQCLQAAEPVDFNRDIRPILSAKCFHCHGPDEDARQADLRVDVDDDEFGPFVVRDGLHIIKPHDLDASEIWQRVTTQDEDAVMPPLDANLEPLTDDELEVVKRWILQGAEYSDYWAFVAPRPQSIPDVERPDWTVNRIDRFVMARLDREGMQPQPRADKRTLIRRVSFDLTGLPPSRAEIHRFLADESPYAYERLVDRLMATPAFGEHMAKYWLDLVRFADTNGIHHDHYREMTPYRDWVIRAFNQNLRFDKFIIDQIAGDLHPQPTLDEQIASGFNRLHLVIDKGTAIPQESFTRNVIDRVTAVGTAFMGLTVGCAVCHDHKYDPMTQRDFYQLYAFFNNIDAAPETPGRGVHAPFVQLPTPEQQARLTAIENRIAAAAADIASLRQTLAESQALQESDENPTDDGAEGGAEQAAVKVTQQATASDMQRMEDRLKQLQKAKQDLEQTLQVSLIMKERPEVRPAHILIRGAYDQPGERVGRDTPAFLPPIVREHEYATRMDLARWLTDRRHPLTARVTVNRLWQQFFGVGLVKTSEDFGTQGDWPSHPELLDDLTINFVNSQWDVKALIRTIVSSQTYQQSSQTTAENFNADPDNQLLARGSRFRIDAEMIRDQILSVSGMLNETMYGKSVRPPQPPNLWKTVSMVSSSTYSFTADTGPKIFRRSLYSFWKRALPPPQMTIFDAPTRESCTARRERTNTPLQALVLMNEGQFFAAAQQFAQQLLASSNMNDQQRLSLAYETVTSHVPDSVELATLTRGLATMRSTYAQDVAAAKAITRDAMDASDAQRVELAAYTMMVNSLFNLDVAKTRE